MELQCCAIHVVMLHVKKQTSKETDPASSLTTRHAIGFPVRWSDEISNSISSVSKSHKTNKMKTWPQLDIDKYCWVTLLTAAYCLSYHHFLWTWITIQERIHNIISSRTMDKFYELYTTCKITVCWIPPIERSWGSSLIWL